MSTRAAQMEVGPLSTKGEVDKSKGYTGKGINKLWQTTATKQETNVPGSTCGVWGHRRAYCLQTQVGALSALPLPQPSLLA